MAQGRFVPSTYRHTQSEASTTWTVAHNLGGNGASFPIVDVLTTEGGQTVKMMPLQVTVVDANTVSITFSVARTGTAIVVV